jgi:hypothetical protein
VGVGLLAVVVLAQVGAIAPAPIPIRVDFDAPAGCADAEAFYAGLSARMPGVRRARPGESATRLIVRLTRNGGKVHGELQLGGGGSASDTRRVDGATCHEVVQVLSLTAALAVNPGAPTAPGAPAAATPAPAPVAARAEVATHNGPVASPAPVVSPTPAIPAPSSTAPTAPLADAPKAPPATIDTVPPPAPPATVASPPAPPPAPRYSPAPRPVGFEVAAGLVATELLSSSLSAGAGISARLAGTARGGLTPSAALALVFLPADFLQSGDDLGVRLTALTATGCPGWALRYRVEVEPCARAALGLLSATDHSVTNPRSVDRSWWSAGALVRATAQLGDSGFTLELTGGVDVPLVKRSFVTTTPARGVGQTPTLSPALTLGVVHRL